MFSLALHLTYTNTARRTQLILIHKWQTRIFLNIFDREKFFLIRVLHFNFSSSFKLHFFFLN